MIENGESCGWKSENELRKLKIQDVKLSHLAQMKKFTDLGQERRLGAEGSGSRVMWWVIVVAVAVAAGFLGWLVGKR